MDLAPANSPGRQIIDSYGDGGFRIGGIIWRQPVLVRPERCLVWDFAGTQIAQADIESFVPLFAPPAVELLLIGCGTRMQPLPGALRRALKDRFSVTVETMDTGAACRTYAVLMGEDRRVAAALIPV